MTSDRETKKIANRAEIEEATFGRKRKEKKRRDARVTVVAQSLSICGRNQLSRHYRRALARGYNIYIYSTRSDSEIQNTRGEEERRGKEDVLEDTCEILCFLFFNCFCLNFPYRYAEGGIALFPYSHFEGTTEFACEGSRRLRGE